MKKARKAIDLAIIELYGIVDSMMLLMSSPEQTALYNQLKGIELFARQFYIKEGSSSKDNCGDKVGGGDSDKE